MDGFSLLVVFSKWGHLVSWVFHLDWNWLTFKPCVTLSVSYSISASVFQLLLIVVRCIFRGRFCGGGCKRILSSRFVDLGSVNRVVKNATMPQRKIDYEVATSQKFFPQISVKIWVIYHRFWEMSKSFSRSCSFSFILWI